MLGISSSRVTDIFQGGWNHQPDREIYQPSRKLHINVATLQQWQSSTVISCHLSWFSISCGPAWQDSHSVVLPKSRGPGQEAQPFHFDGQATRLRKTTTGWRQGAPISCAKFKTYPDLLMIFVRIFPVGEMYFFDLGESEWGNFPTIFVGGVWGVRIRSNTQIQVMCNFLTTKMIIFPLKGVTIPTQLGILVMMIGWSGITMAHIFYIRVCNGMYV